MKKQAKELKKGDRIMIADKKCKIESIEFSDIGKQGSKKARIVAKSEEGEEIVVIRPDNYPFEVK